ncbi:MAG: M14 family metallocarboxypeptidase [Opitutae bacterium]
MSTVLKVDGSFVHEIRSPAFPDEGGIYLSAGIHGDEVAGVEGLTRWAEAEVRRIRKLPLLIFPCLNPWGFAQNSRLSKEGHDLNRLWGGSLNSLTTAIQLRIGGMRFRASINLHEDYEAGGAYLYELSRPGGPLEIGERILRGVEELIPRDTRALIDGRKAINGIIRPRPRNFEPDRLPEALLLSRKHTDLSFTLETPSEFDLKIRAMAHERMIREALRSVF